MSNAVLQLNDLSIQSEDILLVDHITMTIPKGSIMGLVGESGSGKTLTALSILNLLPKNLTLASGSIVYKANNEEVNISSCSTKQLNTIRGNRISMIFQEPMTSLNPTMRCGIQVKESLTTHLNISQKAAKEKTMHLFNEVKLPDPERIYNAWPHELSGGQRQRVMIAQALSTSPDLLIADEPTTALDVTVQKSILELLLGLKEKYKLSILFISHDLMVVSQIADEVSVMYQGKIIESGSKDAVLNNPVSDYAKGLLACKPRLDKKPYRLPTVSDFLQNTKPASSSPKKQLEREEDLQPLLTVSDLTVVYPGRKREEDVTAVKNVSFEVFKGETLGLVGESGCGKTSIGRALLQLINEKSGIIEYKGNAINTLSEKKFRSLRRELQIVFQDPYSSLNPRQTIGSILVEPLIIHQLVEGKKERNAECIRLLEQVGLPSASLNKYPHQFSGGQRQRIGIARALACQPEFIVLDESVSALDVSVQAQVINLLNDLKESLNLTYLFISHDLTVVKYVSDRIIVMSEGIIVEQGDAEQIYLNPANSYTRKLIEAIPR
jgi:peptide/nickel transport system ATP-binding protein